MPKKAKTVGRPKLPKHHAKPQIVPVRFTAGDLKLMNAAAEASGEPLSTWIRFTVKKAIKHNYAIQKGKIMSTGTGTTYQEQIEEGKKIVLTFVNTLADGLSRPDLNELKFFMTSRDFDYNQVSLMDTDANIIIKIEESALADAPADAGVRQRLQDQIRTAVTSYVASHSPNE